MKMKQIAVVVGAAAGLSLAAPGWVVAAGMEGGDKGYQTQQEYQSPSAAGQDGMTRESADTAAMEQGTAQDLMQMQVSELQGKSLKNANGEDLGQIDNIVKDKQDQSLHAVISTGGFLGVGAKKVTVPVDQLKLQNGDVVADISTSPDELQQQIAYDEANYDSIDSNQQLAEAAGVSPGEAEIASFEQLDVDQSGSISRDEAQTHPDLSSNWSQYDTNADDQLDQSEFSAFEETQRGGDAGMQDSGTQPDADTGVSDQSAMEPAAGIASFDSLDSDKDGYISQQEAQQHERLTNNWQDVDVNADNQIDQGEFSAFEAGLQAPDQPDQPAVDSQPGMGGEPGAMGTQ